MRFLFRLLVPIKPFGLYMEGMAWYRFPYPHLAPVSDPTQVGPNRSDPEHYDERGQYLWWGC